MSKYKPLEKYLSLIKKSEITLTFEEIEKILDSKLPYSAFEYQQWWENDSYHTQAKAWRNAGWKVEPVDITNKIVTFLKTTDHK